MSNSRDILVIEDNLADIRLIQEAMKNLKDPATLHFTTEGEDAMRFLQGAAPYEQAPVPDLIFLDYHIPRVDSRDILRFIRGSERLKDVYISVLTTSQVEDLIREAYALGASCFISKPSDLTEFLYTVSSAAEFWLEMARMRRQEGA